MSRMVNFTSLLVLGKKILFVLLKYEFTKSSEVENEFKTSEILRNMIFNHLRIFKLAIFADWTSLLCVWILGFLPSLSSNLHIPART